MRIFFWKAGYECKHCQDTGREPGRRSGSLFIMPRPCRFCPRGERQAKIEREEIERLQKEQLSPDSQLSDQDRERLRRYLDHYSRDVIEEMAEAAHNAWFAEKKARGVTTWPNEHGFEQMVPYDECPEDVKEFDRVVVRAIARRLAEGIKPHG